MQAPSLTFRHLDQLGFLVPGNQGWWGFPAAARVSAFELQFLLQGQGSCRQEEGCWVGPPGPARTPGASGPVVDVAEAWLVENVLYSHVSPSPFGSFSTGLRVPFWGWKGGKYILYKIYFVNVNMLYINIYIKPRPLLFSLYKKINREK